MEKDTSHLSSFLRGARRHGPRPCEYKCRLQAALLPPGGGCRAAGEARSGRRGLRGAARPVPGPGGAALPRAESAPSPPEAQRRRRAGPAAPRGHACAGTAARLRREGAGGRRRRSLPSRGYASADAALRSAGRGRLRRCPAAPTGPSPDRFALGTQHAGGSVTSCRRRVLCVCERSSPGTCVGFCDAKETGARYRCPLR